MGFRCQAAVLNGEAVLPNEIRACDSRLPRCSFALPLSLSHSSAVAPLPHPPTACSSPTNCLFLIWLHAIFCIFFPLPSASFLFSAPFYHIPLAFAFKKRADGTASQSSPRRSADGARCWFSPDARSQKCLPRENPSDVSARAPAPKRWLSVRATHQADLRVRNTLQAPRY